MKAKYNKEELMERLLSIRNFYDAFTGKKPSNMDSFQDNLDCFDEVIEYINENMEDTDFAS